MQYIFSSAKRLISIFLVTLLLVTTTLLSFPTPARAAGDVVILKCESNCGNMAAFTAGMVGGSAVTLAATGSVGDLAAAGITSGAAVIVHAATTVAAPLAAVATPAVVAAAPIVVPVAATAAVGYGAYRFLKDHDNNQAQPSK